MIPRFTWSCKNPWNSTCTKWNLVIKIFKEVKLLKPLTYIICSMGRIEHIDTYFFMMKCEIKIFFPWNLCPHWGMEQRFAHCKNPWNQNIDFMRTLGPLISSSALIWWVFLGWHYQQQCWHLPVLRAWKKSSNHSVIVIILLGVKSQANDLTNI